MAWLLFGWVAINSILLNAYLDTNGNVGGEGLLLFNIPVISAGILFYIFLGFPSDR